MDFLALEPGWLSLRGGVVHRDGRCIALTESEHALVQHLAASAPTPVAAPELLQGAWGYAPGVNSHTVKTTVSRIRSKLGSARGVLETVRGQGYRLAAEPGLPPAGSVVLVLLTVSAPPDQPGRPARLDELLEACPAPDAFPFLDLDRGVGLAFGGIEPAARWVLHVLRSAPTPGPHLAVAASGGNPPDYAGRGRDRLRELAADPRWGGVDVEPGLEVPGSLAAMLQPHTVTSPVPVVRDRRPIRRWRSRFVGRDADLARVQALLDAGPLVSVCGPGGVGKTRLACRVAGEDALFVDLSGVTGCEGVLAAVIGAAGLDAVAHTPEAVADALEGRVPLVVVDNAESDVAAVGEVVDRWLTAVPEARFLTTSRIRLGLDGERVHQLGPMDQAEARALFCDRAAALAGRTVVDDAAVGELVDRLDRLPLALELAAAQVPVLGVRGVLGGLEARFEMLEAVGDAPSLASVIAQSVDRVAESDRRALRWLGVFEGPVPPADALAVLAAGGLPVPRALLGTLGRASLLQVEGDGDTARLVLLESVRAFARDALQVAGEASDAHDAHARWVRGRVADRRDGPVAWRRRLFGIEAELYAAVRHLARREPETAVQVLEQLVELYDMHGPPAGYQRALDAVLDGQPRPGASALGRAWLLRSRIHRLRAELGAAEQALARALELAESAGDRRTAVSARAERAQHRWGTAAHADAMFGLLDELEVGCSPESFARFLLVTVSPATAADGRADGLLRRAQAIQDRLHSSDLELRLALTRTRLAHRRHDPQRVLAHGGAARALARQLGRPHRALLTLVLQAQARLDLGDLDGGAALLRKAIDEGRHVGGPDLAMAHVQLGHVHRRRGAMADARPCYDTALATRGVQVTARAEALSGLAGLAELEGRPHDGLALGLEALVVVPPERSAGVWGARAAAVAGTLADLGRVDEARAHLLDMEGPDGPARPPWLPACLRWAEARIAVAEGRLDLARQAVDAARADPWWRTPGPAWLSAELLSRALATSAGS